MPPQKGVWPLYLGLALFGKHKVSSYSFSFMFACLKLEMFLAVHSHSCSLAENWKCENGLTKFYRLSTRVGKNATAQG